MTVSNAQPIIVPNGSCALHGELVIPDRARGVVMMVDEGTHDFALQQQLNANRFATLQLDLLTPDERADVHLASLRGSDVQFLADRIAAVTDWLCHEPGTEELPIGYFGSGVAAAAIAAAAGRPTLVSAIVCSNGRPLLARPALPQVRAPTLLIVLETDIALVKLNHYAMSQMLCEKSLEVLSVGDADQGVSRLALPWFARYLVRASEEVDVENTDPPNGARGDRRAKTMHHVRWGGLKLSLGVA